MTIINLPCCDKLTVMVTFRSLKGRGKGWWMVARSLCLQIDIKAEQCTITTLEEIRQRVIVDPAHGKMSPLMHMASNEVARVNFCCSSRLFMRQQELIFWAVALLATVSVSNSDKK